MRISVIIPTYKPQDYLWECLDSLVQQTFSRTDFEVIIVLNGCCSPWKEMIDAYIMQNMSDMNVTFIQTNIGGVSNARNIAIDIAKGEYVTFIDDDDYVSKSFLQCLYDLARKDTIVISNVLAFKDGFKDDFIHYQLTDIYNQYSNHTELKISSRVRKFFSGPCMKLISKDIIQDRHFDDRFKNGEDSLFMFMISDMVQHIEFTLPDAVYYRRYRAGSAMTSRRTYKDIIWNNCKLIKEYSKIFFNTGRKYNFKLYITRIAAAIHSIAAGVKKL